MRSPEVVLVLMLSIGEGGGVLPNTSQEMTIERLEMSSTTPLKGPFETVTLSQVPEVTFPFTVIVKIGGFGPRQLPGFSVQG